MTENRILYPGTFDPITLGHIDLIERASQLFGHVVVAIAANPLKTPLFSLSERLHLVKMATHHVKNITILGFDCLLTDFAQQQGIRRVMRGLRAASDFEFEFQLANMNRRMKPDLETLFLTPDEKYTCISSSLVREIAHYGGDVASFVPTVVAQACREKFSGV